MQTTDAPILERLATADLTMLEAMVGPDPHRPGPARWRLLAEQVPIRAVIGQLGAIAGTTDLAKITPSHVAEVALDYDLSEQAVLAALHYYRRRRGAIDALLEANAEVLRRG